MAEFEAVGTCSHSQETPQMITLVLSLFAIVIGFLLGEAHGFNRGVRWPRSDMKVVSGKYQVPEIRIVENAETAFNALSPNP